jgi:hypothetical protein
VQSINPLCFKGGSRATCSSFVVAEMGVTLPLASSPKGPTYEERSIFDKQLEWQLGVMTNVGDRWAIGPTVGLGSGAGSPVTSLTMRARRWVAPSIALDQSAGAILRTVGGDWSDGLKGARADARLNFADDAFLGVRYERIGVDVPAYRPFGWPYAKGTHRATSVLLGLGGDWALGGTIVVIAGMLAYAWLLTHG